MKTLLLLTAVTWAFIGGQHEGRIHVLAEQDAEDYQMAIFHSEAVTEARRAERLRLHPEQVRKREQKHVKQLPAILAGRW